MNLDTKQIKHLISILVLAIVFLGVPFFLSVHPANAVDNVPDVNINAGPTNDTEPYGGFKLIICDGPEGLNHWNPTTHKIDLSLNADKSYKYPKTTNLNEFRPCNFVGLMQQAQFLINVMIIFGVLAAIIGFVYAGVLYLSGTQANLKKAHTIFPKIFFGFIIMLTAWFMVYQILKWLTGSSAYLNGTIS